MGLLMAYKHVNILLPTGRWLLNGLVFSLLLPCFIFSQLGQAVTLEKMLRWFYIWLNYRFNCWLNHSSSISFLEVYNCPDWNWVGIPCDLSASTSKSRAKWNFLPTDCSKVRGVVMTKGREQLKPWLWIIIEVLMSR
ncbi:hypothetical protein ACFE04_002465 [Oxalis oulophora]